MLDVHPPQGSRVAHRAVRKELARLPAEVLKLLAFCFLQSNSNFVAGLPSLSKGCEGATVPAAVTNFTKLHLLHSPTPESVRSPLRSFETANFQFLCKAFQTLLSAYRTQVRKT